MATNPFGSEHADALEDEEVRRDRLVKLPSRRVFDAPRRRVGSSHGGAFGRIYRIELQFTPNDHSAVAIWASDTDHGYGRLTIERVLLEDDTWATYALVYMPGQAWSTWGLTRQGGHLEVWRCSTGKMVSRHAQMANALASLPHATKKPSALPLMSATKL